MTELKATPRGGGCKRECEKAQINYKIYSDLMSSERKLPLSALISALQYDADLKWTSILLIFKTLCQLALDSGFLSTLNFLSSRRASFFASDIRRQTTVDTVASVQWRFLPRHIIQKLSDDRVVLCCELVDIHA